MSGTARSIPVRKSHTSTVVRRYAYLVGGSIAGFSLIRFSLRRSFPPGSVSRLQCGAGASVHYRRRNGTLW
ncbi:expressed protein [Arabidopsis lyrata subsp. lyrata]|uniref:Expressed protein n=1 Tax=Arabidopsis lyrata subsp. lyrata TaxID=81972 RepID=D7MYD1_ARALL|nr:expressed protein [Arabidopsis lyrata subsp. lyrata]